MRRPCPVVVILSLVAALALLAAARELCVQVREGHLRDHPSFLGHVQARLPPYGPDPVGTVYLFKTPSDAIRRGLDTVGDADSDSVC